MVLDDKNLDLLKHLAFDRATSKQQDICMKCSYAKPNKKCKTLELCNRYGEFTIRDGVETIVKDLFDTIDDLKENK